MSANYSASGPSVPIYIEYRLVPGATEPQGTPIPWASSIYATVSITELDVFHNGAWLDASNTSWNVVADCKVDSASVVSSAPVWSQSSVTAGGASVNPDGVTQPQDPDTSSPTSSYGRYAGLGWSTQVPVTQGSALRCTLSGQRTDPSSPVQLPPVQLETTVDTSEGVDAWAGNYDSGNSLDYEVHFTVTYQQ